MRQNFFFRHFVLLTIVAVGCVASNAKVLVPFYQKSNQSWEAKYYSAPNNEEGAPENWFDKDFDDSSWSSIESPITLGNGKWLANDYSYWVRCHFTIDELNNSSSYTFFVLHDDGCEAFLNGVKIYENNEWTSSGYVSTTLSDEAKATLVEGDNVLCVFVSDTGGGDACMDFGLYEDDINNILTNCDVSVTVTNDENHPWSVEGEASVIRGNGEYDYYAASWLTMSFVLEEQSLLTFEWASYDYSYHSALELYVDGEYNSGNTNSSYSLKRLILDPGEHVIAFRDSVSYCNYTRNWSGIRKVQIKKIVPPDYSPVLSYSDVDNVTFTNSNWLCPWNVENNEAIVRGNSDCPYSTSWLTFSYSSEKNTLLSFEWAMYNYNYHQALQLYIDGVNRGSTSSSTYSPVCFYLEPGDHVIAFRDSVSRYNYSENWSGIRNIQLKEDEPLVIDIPVPGSMGDSILTKAENFSDVYNLKLTGRLNGDDMTTLKNRLTNLYVLDMGGLDLESISAEQFRDKTILQRVILPCNLQSIGNRAFYNCQNLKPITFPATLKSIGEEAFNNTYNIGDVVLPEGLTSLGSYAFYQSHLTSVSFPSTLKSISYECFYNCDFLNEINFNGQTSIDNTAFLDCDALVNVKFPETLQSIGSSAFSYSEKLQNIEFNEGLTSIGDDAFYDCNAIESIVIPSSVQTFNGYDAFRSCNNLKSVTCNAIVPPYTNNGNITGRSGLDLYVPQLSVNVYKQTSGWDQFNIHGTNVMPDNIVIQSAYNLNWPDSLSMDYKPNVEIGRNGYTYGSLSVNGNSTLSARQFTMIYDPNIDIDRGSYWDGNKSQYYRTSYASLVNNAHVRADNVTISLWQRANMWEFITLPFDIKVSDIRLAFEDTPFVIRKYDGQKRAEGLTGETWVSMTADSVLHAGQGYIWRSASTDGNRNFTGFYLDALQTVNKNNIFANSDIEVPLAYYESEFAHNRSWNLIGNPYPCFYDIRAMQTSAPITVWDRYNGNYVAYSPADDAYILNPGQAFFVQRPVDEESIVFQKEGRQNDLTVRDIEYSSRTRAAVFETPRSIFNVRLNAGEQGDFTRFVINQGATLQYDAARDASKFISIENPVVQLYTIEGDVRYAINERPLDNGIIMLGMQIAADGLYTITLDTKADAEVWIIDNLLGVEVRLDGNADGYTFQSEAGIYESRFAIRLGNNMSTGVAEIFGKQSTDSPIYDLQGRRVIEPRKGIYLKNGKKSILK